MKQQKRQCEICGKYKPLNEFSKSYPHRCKPCVAEQTRLSRKEKKMQPIIKAEIDWEQRRYETAKAAMIGLMAGHNAIYEAKKLAPMAIEYADALIDELKKGGNQ